MMADSQQNPYDDIGQVLFLSVNDILRELQLPTLDDSFDTKHWEDLTPDRRAFFSDTASKTFHNRIPQQNWGERQKGNIKA